MPLGGITDVQASLLSWGPPDSIAGGGGGLPGLMLSSLPPSCDRRLQQLHAYWCPLAPAEGGLPARQHFDPLHIPALLPWVWLLDVYRNPLRFKFRLIGTEHARISGRDVTGQWLDEVHRDATKVETHSQLIAAAERATMGHGRGPPLFPGQGEFAEMERLLLPMARNGRDVDMLLAITVYHIKSPAA